ncbi:hypothetical protein [African swine fever virus]|uniref:Hypthetical CDS protein n=1 Tax=African swine fever virus TaxID=10497 RepID=A0A485PQI3_ASF|nr:hypothetical protein IM014_gp072 [African swine fever virus]QGV56996.1 hypothetical protein [African swine fever virus]QXP49997.1 hypothetical protein [African swine fever virus]UID85751.1 hypothetical protein [African swine fever virus]UPH95498.1 hypothetical protein [African swine fever virus]UPH95693.1 hypothetical protein [African swine fever virus]
MNDCLLSIYTYIIFFYEKNIKVVYKPLYTRNLDH